MLNRSIAVLTASLGLIVMMALGGCSSSSCGLGGGGGGGGGGGSSSSATLMLAPGSATGGVGVVRRTDLLVAYYGSSIHADDLEMLQGLLAQAEGSGRKADAAAINAYGAMMQEIAHRQLAENEPIYTVLLGVEDELRQVMSRHGLGRVVEAGPGVEGVDITDELVALLGE